MSYVPRRSLPPSRPYGVRTPVRPVYGGATGLGGFGGAGGGLATALGAVGGTLGCLLCLAAIGALGLFACVIAITAYTKQFLDAYKDASQISAGLTLQLGFTLLYALLFYVIISRLQRN